MTSNIIVCFGASDPEAELAEKLCHEVGIETIYAVHSVTQKRVSPMVAYSDSCRVEIPCDVDQLVLFECRPTNVPNDIHTFVIDHHNPGDPGFGKPANEFLPASSIGQLISFLVLNHHLPKSWNTGFQGVASRKFSPPRAGKLRFFPREMIKYAGWQDEIELPELGWTIGTGNVQYHPDDNEYCEPIAYETIQIPDEYLLAAAADHCLTAAYKGQCPGVDPQRLMIWRAESRAKYQRRKVEDVLKDVESTTQALLNAQRECAHCGYPEPQCKCPQPLLIADMTRALEDGGPYPELPEAAARIGIGYVAGPMIAESRTKYVMSGTPDEVRAWINSASGFLIDIYGDPERGFAGGYLPPNH